jgi:threonylcarbamoyladenosine tRNA methylthiotransferase MtaB
MSDISPSPPSASILTLGCKLNIADSEAMARRLRDAGWRVSERVEADADAVIVNTCSVTHTADRKSAHLVNVARRMAPGATVALTGCLLETAPPERIDSLGAGLVYRQPEQPALAQRLIELHPYTTHGFGIETRGKAFKTRAFISAQEGCNDVCAFCIIPKTRGRERSRTIAWVVDEVQKREAEGVNEVVITGTQLGHYGSDLGIRLHDLMRALLAETSVPRIRMSSVQPQDLTDDLIDLWSDSRLCRHFHLALQSGSETVLQRMRRRYSRDGFRNAVRRLRDSIPGVAITTDVIVGFPCETDAEFEESFDFCREMAFAGIHVFPYSQRSGTVAYKLPGQVPDAVKKQRVHRLIDLAGDLAFRYRDGLVGATDTVLWETQGEDGAWQGLTDTYVRVRARSDADLSNTLTAVTFTAQGEDGLLAEVLA